MSKEDFNKEADDLKHAHIAGALDRVVLLEEAQKPNQPAEETL